MPPRRFFTLALVLTLLSVVAPTGFAYARDELATTAALQGDAARPARSSRWHRAELYFGLGTPGSASAAADEQRWRSFLDEEVTPRFPDGFSVLDAYGQWQRREPRKIERLNSKVLVILYQGRAHRQELDAIRSAWKQRSGDESVLLSITAAEVSF